MNLGSLFTNYGKIEEEMSRHVNEGRGVIGSVEATTRIKNMINKNKVTIYNYVLAPIVLYVSKIWTYQEKDRGEVNMI